MQNKPLSPMSFIWQMIKPYKLWYILILQAPFLTGFFPVLINYSFKLIIDSFSQNDTNKSNIFFAVSLFLGSNMFL